jgi:hypothetical protein
MRLILPFVFAAAFGVSPAYAENVAIGIDNAAASGDLQTATGTGVTTLTTVNLNGVTITGVVGQRETGPNEVSGGEFFINNTTGSTQTIDFAVGAIGYLGPDKRYSQSATINLASGSADFAGQYYVDALDRQMGKDATTTFGVENALFDSGSLTGPHAFSFNNVAFTPGSGSLYSMGETLELTLSPGASVTVDGISMTASAIPEPSTWAMLLIGFIGLAWAATGRRRAREAF